MDIKLLVKKLKKQLFENIHRVYVVHYDLIFKCIYIFIVFCGLFIIYSLLNNIFTKRNYKFLLDTYMSKDYYQAIKYCEKLKNRKDIDITDIVIECKYRAGVSLYDNCEYDSAITILSEIKEYNNTSDIIKDSKYNIALLFYNSGNYESAVQILKEDIFYKDTNIILNNIIEALIKNNNYKNAIYVYEIMKNIVNKHYFVNFLPDYRNLLYSYVSTSFVNNENIDTFLTNDLDEISEIMKYTKLLYDNFEDEETVKLCKKIFFIYSRDIDDTKNHTWICDENDNYFFRIEKCSVVKNKLITDNEDLYYVDNKGKMVTDKIINYNSEQYYFSKSGKAVKNVFYNNYFFGNDYKMVRSTLFSFNNQEYYADENGNIVKNKIIDGYYFSMDGIMLKNGYDYRGVWHNADGTPKYGWVNKDGKWYYFDTNGVAITGWKFIDNLYYYFYELQTNENPKGSMAVNTIIDGYFINKDGVWENIYNNSNVIVRGRGSSKSKLKIKNNIKSRFKSLRGNYVR